MEKNGQFHGPAAFSAGGNEIGFYANNFRQESNA
jgi:hypothetical protein